MDETIAAQLREPAEDIVAVINTALADRIGSWLSKDAEASIRDEFGPEVAQLVRALYDDALDCPIDWRTATMDSALDTLHQYLDANYPWLSDGARRTLNFCFIMAWK